MEDTESFESVYKRLEETVRRLEEGGLTLDESIALYEEGMDLARRCQGLLDQAELRVTNLQDLFTDPAARVKGVGRALINGVYDQAKRAGCSRVYWQTHETNHTAMQLYDKVAERSGFVVYRKML